MLRRLRFFGVGFLLSILILSIGPNNRLKETFLAYVNYFNINKRVIFHLDKKNATIFSDKAICQMLYYNLNKEELLSVLKDGKVNFHLSDKKAVPCQYFVIESSIGVRQIVVNFSYCQKSDSAELLSFYYVGEEEQCINLSFSFFSQE